MTTKLSVGEICVGMPVTISIGTDSYPYEVVGFKGKDVIVRRVEPTNCADWTEGCMTDTYVSSPNGETKVLTQRGKHGWHVKGDYRSSSYGWCYRVRFGRAVYFRDPSF